MAIKKSKILRNGSVGEYWKITKISFDPLSHNLECVLSLFVDKAKSDAGYSSLDMNKYFNFIISNEESLGDLRGLGYTKIKDKASTMITPISSSLSQTPYPFDADLINSEDA